MTTIPVTDAAPGWRPAEGEAPKARRAKALPPEERRQAIVEATLPLLMTYGRAVTTRQIACAAGIAEGTIFRAFPDKDALIEAVVDKALDPAQLEARLAQIDAAAPLEESLLEAVRVLQERVINVWQVVTSAGFTRDPNDRGSRSGFTDVAPLVALFEASADRLRHDATGNARRLRAITIASSHPMLTDAPLEAAEIVSLFLDGIRRPSARNTESTGQD